MLCVAQMVVGVDLSSSFSFLHGSLLNVIVCEFMERKRDREKRRDAINPI